MLTILQPRLKVDRKLKLKCYNTYVRPILEYASSVWSPINQISLIRKIEMVQHKAVCWICSNWDRGASVSNMEASLCMKKLENRQSIAQLKMMRELITGEKQICKKSLPVCQRCTDVRFKPIY